MSHQTRLERLEATLGAPETACCIRDRGDFEGYAVRGICKRTGRSLCAHQQRLATLAAENVRATAAALEERT